MFVITYSIKIINLCSSSGYIIQIVIWCLSLRTAFKWLICLWHYEQQSNDQMVFLIMYNNQMVRLCLSLRTAFKFSVCVCRQVTEFKWSVLCVSLRKAFKWSNGDSHYVQHSNVQFVFVITLQYSNGLMLFLIIYGIQIFSWCLHYVQHSNCHLVFVNRWQHSSDQFVFVISLQYSNVQFLFLITYSNQMISWCSTLRTAFKWSFVALYYEH
jgi:hypothetical protein